MTLLRLLIPGETWQPVAENLGFADAPCTDAEGNFYFADMKAPAVYKVSAKDGTRTELAKEAVSGLEFGPGGLLYGCQGAKTRVISLDPKSGEVKVIASNVTPNDLAVTAEETPWHGLRASAQLRVPPLGAVWLVPEDDLASGS